MWAGFRGETSRVFPEVVVDAHEREEFYRSDQFGRWQEQVAKLTEGERTYRELPLEAWIRTAAPPARWKMAPLTWLGVWPASLLGLSSTVVEYLDRICPGVDEEAANALQRALTKQGITSGCNRRACKPTWELRAFSLQWNALPVGTPCCSRPTTYWLRSDGVRTLRTWGWRMWGSCLMLAAC